MTATPDRILTTHTGSLPRPDDLIQIMWAVGDGIPVDQAALSERVSQAVEEVVHSIIIKRSTIDRARITEALADMVHRYLYR